MLRNAISGGGLPPDTAMVTFPIEVFLPSADLTPLKNRRQEFYDALTRWTADATRAGGSSRMLSVEAATYNEALVKANNLFISNMWGDGLPLWPATRERVDWILRGSPLPRTHVLGKFPPRGGVVTIESCAIALAMAGGRPEYLPVLIAAVDAYLDPVTRSELLQASSGASFPVIIVNGPIAKQIKLNSGFGCLGPDPQHPAGASIGRALRQMQQNLGGALPGNGTMAIWGAMRYNNAVFAEDEEGLPDGWQPYATERHGYAPGTNSVTMITVTGVANVKRRGAGKETAEEDAVQGLYRIAGFMAAPHLHYCIGYDKSTPGIVLISRVVARALASFGWTKKKIQQFLWEHSKIPLSQLERAGGFGWMEIAPSKDGRESMVQDPWPITLKPENIAIVVCGGWHPSHAYWLQGYSYDVIGRTIRVPDAFDALIEEAERDAAAGRLPA